MQRSDQIDELAKALCAAQAVMEGAEKNSQNPHFRSKYADLGAVIDAIREPFTKNGLSVTQWMRSAGHDGLHAVEVETLLMHSSGQWMSDTFAVPVSKVDAQGYGSACTYARRYALMAAVGIAPVDDDANAAVGGNLPAKKQNGRPPAKPKDQPPGDPFEAAKSAVASCEYDRIDDFCDRLVASKFGSDHKHELLGLLQERLLKCCGDNNPDALVKKIHEARKEFEHTFA